MAGKIAFLPMGILALVAARKAWRNDFQTVPRPLGIHFETTYACTCKCQFCGRWVNGGIRRTEELTSRQIAGMFRDAHSMGVRVITLSGGEPLLKHGILDIMRDARAMGMFTNVTHNGTLVNEETVEDVLSAFDMINISLDSLDRERHDRLRGIPGTFDKAMKAVELLCSRTHGTVVNVQSVLTSENFDDLLAINRHFHPLGVGTYFQPIHDDLDNQFTVSQPKLTHHDMTRLRAAWPDFLSQYRFPGWLDKRLLLRYYRLMPDFMEDPDATRACFYCLAGSLTFFVDPYGDVFPCDPIRLSIGNLNEESLVDIWNGEKARAARLRAKHRTCNCWLLCSAPIFINASKVIL